MGLLDGKTILVTGVANRWSIASGIVRQMHAHGARLILTYQGERVEDAVRKTVGPEIEKVMKTSGVATKTEVDELKAQIAELKAMLAGQSGGATADEVTPPSYPDE